jgi:GxxExxY protein
MEDCLEEDEKEILENLGEPPGDAVVNGWTRRIIGAAVRVHRALGAGYSEDLYENALAHEFQLSGIPFQRQFRFEVRYKDVVVGTGRADFLVADLVIVELKAVERLTALFVSQTISYLRANRKRVALLINFNVPVLIEGVRRIAY